MVRLDHCMSKTLGCKLTVGKMALGEKEWRQAIRSKVSLSIFPDGLHHPRLPSDGPLRDDSNDGESESLPRGGHPEAGPGAGELRPGSTANGFSAALKPDLYLGRCLSAP